MFKNLLSQSVKTIFVVCFLAAGIYVNAECRAWTDHAYDDGPGGVLRDNYLSIFTKNCHLFTGNLFCYWPNWKEACKGGVKEREWQGVPGATYTPLLEPEDKINNNSYYCNYKITDPSGSVTIASREFTVDYVAVAEQPTESYCNITDAQGPYRGCADGDVQPGGSFSRDQENKIKGLNVARGGKSDLAGVTIGGYTETNAPLMDDDDTRADTVVRKIHYIIPPKDRQTCNCGTNSYKNAIVISKELSERLGNKPPPPAFLEAVRNARKYPCSN